MVLWEAPVPRRLGQMGRNESHIAIFFFLFSSRLVSLGLVCLDSNVCMVERKMEFRWLSWGKFPNSGKFCIYFKNLFFVFKKLEKFSKYSVYNLVIKQLFVLPIFLFWNFLYRKLRLGKKTGKGIKKEQNTACLTLGQTWEKFGRESTLNEKFHSRVFSIKQVV